MFCPDYLGTNIEWSSVVYMHEQKEVPVKLPNEWHELTESTLERHGSKWYTRILGDNNWWIPRIYKNSNELILHAFFFFGAYFTKISKFNVFDPSYYEIKREGQLWNEWPIESFSEIVWDSCLRHSTHK